MKFLSLRLTGGKMRYLLGVSDLCFFFFNSNSKLNTFGLFPIKSILPTGRFNYLWLE